MSWNQSNFTPETTASLKMVRRCVRALKICRKNLANPAAIHGT